MNDSQPSYRRLWIAFAFVIIGSFAVLGGFGFHIASMAPPVPRTVRTPDGVVLFDGDLIREGQNVWQSLGGQQVGTVWGHGAYIAPDWSADWLHRECVFILDGWARERGAGRHTDLSPEDRAALRARLKRVMRDGGAYDSATGVLTMVRPGEHRSLLTLFLISSLAIAGFYAAGLGIWKHTHLAMAEYWRWWVVHLWVEGFFEVFATVVIAFLFSRLQLVRTTSATAAALFLTCIFLSGGIIGTFHHLYFSGTPAVVMALGAVFSALEVVPLVLIGFEAWENLRLARVREWVGGYRWAIYFFVAVAFWNMLGAGLFGFMINPPIALYYMQGLNTTPVHGHTALFGVYGMLGLGLMLFCVRGLMPGREWRTGAIRLSFWAINVGLFLMVALSLLPVGLMQTSAAVNEGTWYARSAEFLQTPTMQTLRWLRVPGDTLFALGVLALGWFKLGLLTGHSFKGGGREVPAGRLTEAPEEAPVA